MKNLLFIAPTIAAFTLSACGKQNEERNIIVNRSPFYAIKLPYREGSEDKIISVVKTFAQEHGMDYLGGPGHPSLKNGQFNLTAAGQRLNLKAIRVATSLPDTMIYATARDQPTLEDKALTAEFVRRVEMIR